MVYTPNAVVLEGFPFGIFTFTYEMSGVAQTDDAAAATLGKAVSLDTGAPGTVKLAADGEEIFGRVYTCENRAVLGTVTAAIARKFKERLPAAPAHGIVVGDRVVGDGAGLVRKAAAGTPAEVTASQGNIVIATGDEYVIVEML
jgi:hypothetical protein